MADIQILLAVVGAIIGIISGSIIGSFSVYSRMNSANNIGSQWNPEYTRADKSAQNAYAGIVVGVLFLLIGALVIFLGITVFSTSTEGLTCIAFGIIVELFAALAITAGVKSMK